MQLNRIVSRRIRRSKDGVNIVADVNVAVAGSLDEPGATTRTSSSSRQTVVQRSRAQTVRTTNEEETHHDEPHA